MNVNGIGAGLASAAQRPGSQMGKDQFLQLLVAQLRHQDPLNPADPKDFAAQLAQFSTLEQLMNIGDQLKAAAANDRMMIELVNGNSASAVLGRDILALGDQFMFDPEADDASVTVGVGGAGGTAVLRIFDEHGREVGGREVGWLGAGRQNITLGDAMKELPAGKYRYEVEIRGSDGKDVPVQTYTSGLVTGIQYTNAGPMLMCGDIAVSLGNVIEVSMRK